MTCDLPRPSGASNLRRPARVVPGVSPRRSLRIALLVAAAIAVILALGAGAVPAHAEPGPAGTPGELISGDPVTTFVAPLGPVPGLPGPPGGGTHGR